MNSTPTNIRERIEQIAIKINNRIERYDTDEKVIKEGVEQLVSLMEEEVEDFAKYLIGMSECSISSNLCSAHRTHHIPTYLKQHFDKLKVADSRPLDELVSLMEERNICTFDCGECEAKIYGLEEQSFRK